MAAHRVTRRPRRQAGFTMIEVMIAILLTAIAIIGILALYMAQTRATSFSRHTTEATVLASDGLEKLRTVATPATLTETSLDALGNTVTGGPFTRTSTVTPQLNFYDVTVAVAWEEDGVIRTVTLNGRRNL